MTDNRKKKTEEQILFTVKSALGNTVSLRDSKLARERRDALEYYYGQLPKPNSKGNSKFVSQDVYKSVESAKSDILETFSGHTNNIQFTPVGPEDVEEARVATEYCSYIFYQRNDGLNIMNSVITDGLLARVGVVQVVWDEIKDEVEEEIEGTVDVIDMALSESKDPVKLEELEELGPDENGEPTYRAHLVRTVDMSMVNVEPVPPEEFGISTYAATIKSANITFRLSEKSKSDLEQEGYDQDKIEQITYGEKSLQFDSDRSARHEDTTKTSLNLDETYDDVLETADIYDAYIKMDVAGTGIARLWHVIYAEGVILKMERATKSPFIAFTPIPIPHAFHGALFVDKVRPIQEVRSVLIRSIIDHSVVTNAPRWQVTKGGLMNPRELMDTRIGGIVNVTRPDAVMPLQQAPLNPFVFQTIQLLDQTSEETTGVSRLSQGMNKDAVSKQNSQGLVNDLVNLSKQRQKIMARQFGDFMKAVYLAIYECVIEYDDKQSVIDVAGSYAPVDPTRWRQRKDVKVELALGLNEREQEAQKMMALHQFTAMDPGLAPMYPLEKKTLAIHKVWEKMGVRDTSTYLLMPKEIKPPQPDPMMVAQLEELKATIKKMEADAMATMAKVKSDAATKAANSKLAGVKVQSEFAIKADALDLKHAEFEHKKQIDAEEVALAYAAQEMGTLKAIATPDA